MSQFSTYEEHIGPTIVRKFNSSIFDTYELKKDLPTTYQKLIHQLHYARFISEESRREIWSETVFRFMNYIYERSNECGYTLTQEEFVSLYTNICNLEVLPSMRLLWCAGEAVRNNAVSNYSCAFVGIQDVSSFSEILFLGMSAVGVGFSVEERYIKELPEIAPIQKITSSPIIIEDSREGWANALYTYMIDLFAGFNRTVIYDRIRPAGHRLKVAGGFSSGAAPLKELFEYIEKVFLSTQGKRLSALQCHDLVCKIANAAVAGGTRRSALISFSDLTDNCMKSAKAGEWYKEYPYRSLANNSAVFTEKPEYNIFSDEWENMVESKSGERGIFNQHASLNKIRMLGRRNSEVTYRSNPCFAQETLVVTKTGIYPIKLLVDKEVDIWNGYNWETVNNFRVTGQNQKMLKFTFQNGSVVRLTPSHTCILKNGVRLPASECVPGMQLQYAKYEKNLSGKSDKSGYLKGFLYTFGDINSCSAKAYIRLPYQYRSCFKTIEESLDHVKLDEGVEKPFSNQFMMKTYGESILPGLGCHTDEVSPWCDKNKHAHCLLEVLTWDYQSKIDFITGMFDASGVANDDEGNISYFLRFDNQELAQIFQILLTSIQIKSVILQADTSLLVYISNRYAVELASNAYFRRLTSFAQREYLPEFVCHDTEIKKVEEDERDAEVYCCTVASNNSFALANDVLFGNCSEILLQNRQFCNLSNVNIRPLDTYETLKNKVKLATILGTIQSTITNFPNIIRPEWRKMTEDERLLGVSLSGIADHYYMFPTSENSSHLPKLLSKLRHIAVETNREWAHKLAIQSSTAITTIKPSGDSSQLSDVASGIHPRYAPYYMRRIRMNAVDPIAIQLIDRGLPYEQDINNKNVFIFSFPQKSPKNTEFYGSTLSPVHHLNIWLKYMKYWAEHTVSCTIMSRNHQWNELKEEVYNNFDDICGLSFLPYDDHIYQQAPYEEITANQFNLAVKNIPEINFHDFREYEDVTQSPAACSGEMCTLSDKK